MKDSKQLLSSLLHTVQMGQTGIRSVRDYANGSALRQELDHQLKEYDSIEKEALALAKCHQWTLSNVPPAVRKMADFMSRMRLISGNTDSKIAAMLIQGNTRGMIIGVRNLHESNISDCQITALANQLLDCESINIQKTQPFL